MIGLLQSLFTARAVSPPTGEKIVEPAPVSMETVEHDATFTSLLLQVLGSQHIQQQPPPGEIVQPPDFTDEGHVLVSEGPAAQESEALTSTPTSHAVNRQRGSETGLGLLMAEGGHRVDTGEGELLPNLLTALAARTAQESGQWAAAGRAENAVLGEDVPLHKKDVSASGSQEVKTPETLRRPLMSEPDVTLPEKPEPTAASGEAIASLERRAGVELAKDVIHWEAHSSPVTAHEITAKGSAQTAPEQISASMKVESELRMVMERFSTGFPRIVGTKTIVPQFAFHAERGDADQIRASVPFGERGEQGDLFHPAETQTAANAPRSMPGPGKHIRAIPSEAEEAGGHDLLPAEGARGADPPKYAAKQDMQTGGHSERAPSLPSGNVSHSEWEEIVGHDPVPVQRTEGVPQTKNVAIPQQDQAVGRQSERAPSSSSGNPSFSPKFPHPDSVARPAAEEGGTQETLPDDLGEGEDEEGAPEVEKQDGTVLTKAASPQTPLRKSDERIRQTSQSLPVETPVNHHQTKTEGTIATQSAKPAGVLSRLPDDFGRNLMLKISDNLRLHIEGRRSEVRVVLKPETLGELSIRVVMQDERLTARVDVREPIVKAALEAQIPQLQEALLAQGIEISRFDIVSGGEEMQFNNPGEGRAFQQRPRSRQRMDVDGTEEYETMKDLGYNTMEYIV